MTIDLVPVVRCSPLFLPGGALGDPYSFKLRVLGGPSQTLGRDETGLYVVTQIGGTLPNGVTLDGSNLVVAGTPQEGGNFDPQLRFTDPVGDTFSSKRLRRLFVRGAGKRPVARAQ